MALWAVWGTLALLVAVLVAGGFHLVRTGLRTWRDVRRFTALVGAGGDVLSRRADSAGRKVEGLSAHGERAAAAVEHLQQSVAYAHVVAGAAGDTFAVVNRLRGAVPRK
jgi:hypothetical protein